MTSNKLTRTDAAILALDKHHAGVNPAGEWTYVGGEFLPRSECYQKRGETHTLEEWADIAIELTR